MANLTERQTLLLKIIVDDYIKTAKPVGSVGLVEKQGLKVSSATVRNEMARLIKEGFLEQPHTSAGRIPTTLGFRYYVDFLLAEEELPVLKEVAIKQRLWQERADPDKVLRQTALSLAENSGYFALISGGPGRLFSAGAVNLLEHPEFFDIDVSKVALGLADREDDLKLILSKAPSEKEVVVLIGQETGFPKLKDCALVSAVYTGAKYAGQLTVLGPARMDFAKVIPLLRYFKNLLNEIGQGW